MPRLKHSPTGLNTNPPLTSSESRPYSTSLGGMPTPQLCVSRTSIARAHSFHDAVRFQLVGGSLYSRSCYPQSRRGAAANYSCQGVPQSRYFTARAKGLKQLVPRGEVLQRGATNSTDLCENKLLVLKLVSLNHPLIPQRRHMGTMVKGNSPLPRSCGDSLLP